MTAPPDRDAKDGSPSADDLVAKVAALGDPSKAVQRGAADALVALDRSGVAVRPLLEAALVAANPRQRWGAAFALGQLGMATPPVVDILIGALADGDLRWAAAGLVLRLLAPDVLVTRLLGAWTAAPAAQRKMLLYCLRDAAEWTSRAERLALDALRDVEPSVRLAAMSALARCARDREQAAAATMALLEDPDAGVRRAAAASLGQLGVRTRDIEAALQRAATGTDQPLARAAARALERIGGTAG